MRKMIFLFFFSVAGAALNIIINEVFVISVFGLTLYIDTIFTISVTLIGGFFWGCLTGALTNIAGHTLLHFWGWEGYLFSLCSIATAYITWKFSKVFKNELSFNSNNENSSIPDYSKSRKFDNAMNKVFALTLLSFALCIAMSVMGGLISSLIEIFRTRTALQVIMDESVLNPATPWPQTDFYGGYPVILREIFARIPMNIIDRIISVFAGFGIAYAIVFTAGKFKTAKY